MSTGVQLGNARLGGPSVQLGGSSSSSGSTYYAGASVISAIQAWWQQTLASDSLTSLNKLWFRTAPENSQVLPYATIIRVSQVPDTITTSYSLMRTVVQINVHAATAEAAETLGETIRASLSGAALVVNSVPVDHVLPDGDSLDVGQGLGVYGEDCWIAMETFDVVWTRN